MPRSRTIPSILFLMVLITVLLLPLSKAHATIFPTLTQNTSDTLGSVGQTYTLNWSDPLSGGSTFSATETLTVAAKSQSSLLLDISIENTSTLGSGISQIAVTGLDFNASSVTGASLKTPGTYITHISTNSSSGTGTNGGNNWWGNNWGNTWGNFGQTYGSSSTTVCVYAGTGCASGPVNLGVPVGKSDSLAVDLFLTSQTCSLPTVTLSTFTLTFGDSTPPSGTPEPKSLLLFASALLGFRFFMRRRKPIVL